MVFSSYVTGREPPRIMISELRQWAIDSFKGYRTPKREAPSGTAGPVDGYAASSSAAPLIYSKARENLAPAPDPSSLKSQGQQVAERAAVAAVAGPAGVATGLTLESLRATAQKTTLEDKSVLMGSLQRVSDLQKQSTGIVELPKGVPTMVIPDLHAQRDYLLKALEHQVDGVKVLDLLKQGKMNLLCLGDGMHSENRGYLRWKQAEQDHLHGNRDSKAMRQEVVESFGTMKMVMDLKEALGEHFVYLRGNHDDIAGGVQKFCTEVSESELMASWVKNNYGTDLFSKWADFEQSMPLVAKGTGFVASHAAPGTALTRGEIENRDDRAVKVLTWTDNTGWNEHGARRDVFRNNLEMMDAGPFDRWLVGHRKVQNANFRAQFDNALVQINPTEAEGYVVAVVGADGRFDPGRDTFRL